MAFWRLRRALLKRGDVLRTHPWNGYWGCAVVLGARGATREFYPQCLLAITPWVFEHEYGFDEVRDRPLELLLEEGRPALRIHSCERIVGVTRIGRLDLSGLDLPPVSFEVRPWRPLCGALDGSVGRSAVAAWRREHDSERYHAEIEATRARDRARREQPRDEPPPLRRRRDHSTRTRLPAAPGELWIGLRVSPRRRASAATPVRRVVEEITDRIEWDELGEWLGQSTGRGCVDVSFEVQNLRRARARVIDLLKREFPEYDFWISDDYETTFEA